MKLAPLPANASGEEVSAALERDGAVIVDSILGAAQVDDVMAELQPWIEKTTSGPDSFAGRNTRRTGALIARSPNAASW